jgi:hypothetical protein
VLTKPVNRKNVERRKARIMARLEGRFYLKRTSNENLIGEFSHNIPNEAHKTYTESCDSIAAENRASDKSAGSHFIGKYYSTWQEGGTAQIAELTIERSTGNAKLLTLTWRRRPSGTGFRGQGMLCDDILIGDYQALPPSAT